MECTLFLPVRRRLPPAPFACHPTRHAIDDGRLAHGQERYKPYEINAHLDLNRLGIYPPAAVEKPDYCRASAPATTSRMDCVISAWRARFIASV